MMNLAPLPRTIGFLWCLFALGAVAGALAGCAGEAGKAGEAGEVGGRQVERQADRQVGRQADRRAAGETSTVEAGADVSAGPGPTTLPGTDEDWGIMREQARWAYRNGLDTLPIGQLVARIGERFVGTPYAPYTLEVEGEEGLVIELQELDCVTFV